MRIFFLFFVLFNSDLLAQPGNIFFNAPFVHSINIQFNDVNYFDSLSFYKEQGDLNGIEKYISAQVIIDNDTLQNVGIRFRGNSSYNHPGTKKPIQLDFNKFVSGQKYDGLRKLNLNNSYLDPTQIREKLFLDILQGKSVNAPRATYSAVYFNNEYIGLYKAIQTINKEFLENNFNDDGGNLYKCEPEMPLTWEGNAQSLYYDNAELKNNENLNDWTDLVNFIYLINNSGEEFETEIREIFNLDSYIKTWALNNIYGNLDSYFYLPHNFYLYHDSLTEKFEWITWDVSLAFGVYALLVVPNSIDFDILYLPVNSKNTHPLNYHILADENLRAQYLSEVCSIMKNDFYPGILFPKIDSLANVIRPFVETEPLTNRMFSLQEFENNLNYKTVNYQLLGQIPGLKDFIQKRKNSIFKQFCNLNWSCGLNREISNEETISIYPNPGNEINLKFISSNENKTSEFIISDLSGRKIKQWTHQNISGVQNINLKNLSAGTYILKMESGCKSASKKFVVVK